MFVSDSRGGGLDRDVGAGGKLSASVLLLVADSVGGKAAVSSETSDPTSRFRADNLAGSAAFVGRLLSMGGGGGGMVLVIPGSTKLSPSDA